MPERLTELEIDELHHLGVTGGDEYLTAAVAEIRALRQEVEAAKVIDELDVPTRPERLAPGDLPTWDDSPLSDDELNFLRGFVRSMVTGGHLEIARIISHAENQIMALRSQVSMLRQDRREAWLANAHLRNRLIDVGVAGEELADLVAPS